MSLIMMIGIGVGLAVVLLLVIVTTRRGSIEEVRLTGPAPVRALSAPPTPEVVALVREGKKIEAIKLYKEQTGLGLKESKDAVDAI